MEKVGDYLKSSLRLDISLEKSGITHAKAQTQYLGYTVQTYSRPKMVRTKRANTRYTTQKAIRERVLLGIPGHKITDFMRKHGSLNLSEFVVSRVRAHVHEEAAKRSTSFHKMGAATLKRSFASQPVCMRYKLL